MSRSKQEPETEAERPKRLGATEVARRLLERRSGDRVKIELATTARGVVTIGVELELTSETPTTSIVEAGIAAQREFDRLRAAYPFTDLADAAKGST